MGTCWGRFRAGAPQRRGRFWVLGGEEKGRRRRGRERQNQPFHKPSTTLSGKEDIQSSHIYRETAFTHSHLAVSNTINNNQAIPPGIHTLPTTFYCCDFRQPQSIVVIETARPRVGAISVLVRADQGVSAHWPDLLWRSQGSPQSSAVSKITASVRICLRSTVWNRAAGAAFCSANRETGSFFARGCARVFVCGRTECPLEFARLRENERADRRPELSPSAEPDPERSFSVARACARVFVWGSGVARACARVFVWGRTVTPGCTPWSRARRRRGCAVYGYRGSLRGRVLSVRGGGPRSLCRAVGRIRRRFGRRDPQPEVGHVVIAGEP